MSVLPPPLAELETRLGIELDAVDAARATAALADATTLALAEVPTATATTWAAGGAPKVAELVILTAARRGFENPRGINQETLGAHTVGLSDSTGVYLTTRELATIQRAGGRRRVATVPTPSALSC